MFSLNALSWFYARPQSIGPEKLRLRKLMVSASSCVGSISSVNPDSDDYVEKLSGRPSGFSGTSIVESVNLGSGKLRLDAWITSRISGISRARVQSSIRSGLVSVNSHVITKVSHVVRDGDIVDCTISELQPLKAEPEDIPLDIVYEDDCVLVVNKPAHMVVHPAPGNATGTLVNGILYHCRLSEVSFFDVEPLSDDDEAFDLSIDQASRRTVGFDLGEASVRPGIVHRLDKGTSGLLVVAKDELSHAHLAQQFKKHTIKRVYLSVTCGVPSPISGRINIPVGRDANNRIRMIAVPGSSTHGKARHAVSRNTSGSLCQVRLVHAQFLKATHFDLSLYSKLLSLYSNHRQFSDAKAIRRSALKPCIFSFTSLICNSSKYNDSEYTLSLFSQMLSIGLLPHEHVLPCVIKACAKLLASKIGKQVHGYSVSAGLLSDAFVSSSLVHLYVKCRVSYCPQVV